MKIKLQKGEIEQTTKDPLVRFRNGIKSTETLNRYERKLKILLCHTLSDYLDGVKSKRDQQKKFLRKNGKIDPNTILDADFEERVVEFVEKAKSDPDWVESMFLTYSKKLKERTKLPENDPNYLNPQSFSNYFKAPKKLFKMNNVRFNWDVINATFPELDNDNETRSYDVSEIQRILKFANPLEHATVCIAASSGIRRGGFDFTWDCIVPIYQRNGDLVMGKYDDENDDGLVCGMIIVYKKSSEQYFAFFTPEAWNAIKIYRDKWCYDLLRNPKHDDPFLKHSGGHLKKLEPDALANRIYKLLLKSGVRKPLTDGKRRHEVPVLNGFRRFFNKINKETLSRDSPLGSLIKKELMLSHTGLIHLDKNYFKIHWKELVEEYLSAVPALTISSDARQKLTILKLQDEKTHLEKSKIENEVLQDRIQRQDQVLENMQKKLKKLETKNS